MSYRQDQYDADRIPALQACGHISPTVEGDCCAKCTLLALAEETRDGIAAGDELWAGEMAERAAHVAGEASLLRWVSDDERL